MSDYFPIDDMREGESVTLRVDVQNAYLPRFPKGTAVKVTRGPEGWIYSSPGGTTRAGFDVQPNPGHQGMNAHVSAVAGAPYHIGARLDSVVLRDAFKAQRGKGYGALQALAKARMWIDRERAASEALAAAEVALAEARKVDSRRYAPGMVAAEAARKAAMTESTYARRMVKTYATRPGPGKRGLILSTDGGPALSNADGALHNAYGHNVRWIESPESKGLRFVGLQDDVRRKLGRRSDTTAYWLDDDGCESVSGVVYQLPARKGRVRFLAGYADPYNCDKAGRGPACLSVEIHESAPAPGGMVTRRYRGPQGMVSQSFRVTRQEAEESAHADALADALTTAEAIAERMAEEEREYQEANRAGRDAREKAAEAKAAGLAWVAAMRDLRGAWAARLGDVRIRRYAGGMVGPVYSELRAMVAEVRNLCESYIEAREAARDTFNDSKPGRYASDNVRDAFACGYREGN